jgi:hypothetical protein
METSTGTIAPQELKRQRARERKAIGLRWDTILPSAPPVDLSKVIFSAHALEQFSIRFPAHARGDPEKGARELLALSTEADSISKVGIVRRLIDNGFEEARYFRLGKCRFVVKEQSDGTFIVLTIEWAYWR